MILYQGKNKQEIIPPAVKKFGINSKLFYTNLDEMKQKEYMDDFLQINVPVKERVNKGLEKLFRLFFNFEYPQKGVRLEYINYTFAQIGCTPTECIISNISYSIPLIVKVRIYIKTTNADGKEKIKDKVQEVFLGKLPVMDEEGAFIINGVRKAIISQFQRSLGIFFGMEENKLTNKEIFVANIIPNRGSWLEFRVDTRLEHESIMTFRIDKKKKIPVTILLRALGITEKEIFNTFYTPTVLRAKGKDVWVMDFDMQGVSILSIDLIDAETGKLLLKKGSVINDNIIRILKKKGLKKIQVSSEFLVGKYIYTPITNDFKLKDDLEESVENKDILFRRGHVITREDFEDLRNIKELRVISSEAGLYIVNTYNSAASLKINSRMQALVEIFIIVSASELSLEKGAEEYFNNLFFNNKKYDLSVGRIKINTKLGLDVDTNILHLTKEDIVATIQGLIRIVDKEDKPDDIDHLGNKRLRSVAELFENQFYIGCSRFMKVFTDKINTTDLSLVENALDLMSPKILMVPIYDFCATSSLSQFLDQLNILSELVHNRKFSALGPGGLDKERASSNARNVHYSYPGRLCLIETPEGLNSGLIYSPAIHTRKNKFGFLEAPYRKVKAGIILDIVIYLSADLEDNYKIANTIKLDVAPNGKILTEKVVCKYKGDIVVVPAKEVDLVFYDNAQMSSASATLIPCSANSPSVRIQMGVNMYRQSLPSAHLKQQPPIVCTGFESEIVKGSKKILHVENAGKVTYVDNQKIIILKNKPEKNHMRRNIIGEGQFYSYPDIDIYYLATYERITKNLNNLQHPVVQEGQVVKKGDVLTDASGVSNSQLSLGTNVLTAVLSYEGLGYEDGIALSSELCEQGKFKAREVTVYTTVARNTPLGPEKITKDSPLGMNEYDKQHLDESGIIKIGSYVRPGQVLVNKLTPKLSSNASMSEKRLIKFLFNEDNMNITNSSTYATSYGVVTGVEIRERESVDKGNARSMLIKNIKIKNLRRDKLLMAEHLVKKLLDEFIANIKNNSSDKNWKVEFVGVDKKIYTLDENTINEFYSINMIELQNIRYANSKYIDYQIEEELTKIQERIKANLTNIDYDIHNRTESYTSGSELLNEANLFIKVYVTDMTDIIPGDKLAGRHGNKGVVSAIIPKEDMPFMEDGTRVQAIINPLGIPARMNVSQVFEIHLGLASQQLSKNINKMLQDACVNGIKETIYSLLPNDHKEKDFFIEKKLFSQTLKSDSTFKKKIENLRKYLMLIFEGQEDDIKRIKKATVEQIINLAIYYIDNGVQMQTAIFNGVNEKDVRRVLRIANLCPSGQVVLRDGKTGEKLKNKVTVGWLYLLQLDHKAKQKSHGRSTGAYTILTRQPVGGRSKNGGQKMGEMEYWALEGHGASETIKEMSGSKGCDHERKNIMFNEIIASQGRICPSGIEEGKTNSESVKVLLKFLASLCLDLQFYNKGMKLTDKINADISLQELEKQFNNLNIDNNIIGSNTDTELKIDKKIGSDTNINDIVIKDNKIGLSDEIQVQDIETKYKEELDKSDLDKSGLDISENLNRFLDDDEDDNDNKYTDDEDDDEDDNDNKYTDDEDVEEEEEDDEK